MNGLLADVLLSRTCRLRLWARPNLIDDLHAYL